MAAVEFKDIEHNSYKSFTKEWDKFSDLFSIRSVVYCFWNSAATSPGITVHSPDSRFNDEKGLIVTDRSIPGEFSHHPSEVYFPTLR